MINQFIMGRFDAEKYWDDSCAKLPAISYGYYDNVVLAMDELLVSFANGKEDCLVTEHELDNTYKEYISNVGFVFENKTYKELGDFLNSSGTEDLSFLLDTYAIIPEYTNLANTYHFVYDVPEFNSIKDINSKKYSVIVSQKLGLNDYSVIVENVEEFQKVAASIFEKHGKVMIKENFGVSGKGNAIVDNEKKLNQMINHVMKQREKGRNILFILEPVFEVLTDFSTQIRISKSGDIEFISIQKIFNNGTSYGGSIDMDDDTMNFLKSKDYFDNIRRVGLELSESHYFGDVCIDSMILKGGEVIPVVEINARKSMSLIKNAIDRHLDSLNKKSKIGYLFSKEIPYRSELSFSDILQSLGEERILLKEKNITGVIPFTCNTLFVNRNPSKENSRGRIYFYVTADDMDSVNQLLSKLNDVCSKFAR